MKKIMSLGAPRGNVAVTSFDCGRRSLEAPRFSVGGVQLGGAPLE